MTSISSRLGGVCAVLFVALLAVGVTLGFDQPDNDAPDEKWINYMNDDAKLVTNLIGGYLLVAAGIVFLLFLVAMYRRMRSAESNDTGWPMVMLVTGVGWAIGLMVGGIIVEIIPGGIKLGSATPATADTARWLPQIGFGVILVAGGLSAAVMSAVMSLLILQTRVLPAWLGYLGFLAALALLAAASFIPVIIFVLWMLIVGVMMFVRAEPSEGAATG